MQKRRRNEKACNVLAGVIVEGEWHADRV